MIDLRKKISIQRNMREDNKGESGLPPNLLIFIIAAAISVGLILAWMLIITPPLDHIEVTPTTLNNANSNSTFNITVTAYNTDGGMSGCEITIDGAGIDMKAITGDDGSYTFVDIMPTLPPNTNSDFIQVTVSDGSNVVTQSIAVSK